MTSSPSHPTPSTDNCDLVLSASWVLPVAPQNTVLKEHAVAIRDTEIVAIGPTASLLEAFAEAEHRHLQDHVLMPGLVNAHGHAAMTLLRGAGEDQPLQAWLNETIWPLEGRLMNADFVSLGTDLAIAEMIAGGTTTFADMYFFPEVVAERATQAGIRAQVAFPVIEFPNAWSESVDDGVSKGLALCDEYRHDQLIQIAFGPHSAYTVNASDLGKVAMYANELDVPVQIHLHENLAEVQEAAERIGHSWLKLLDDIGLLGPNLQAVHMTQLDADDIELVARTQTRVVHCPTSNLKLASGYCPTGALAAAGVQVGLGTDGAASNNQLDMFDELRLASLLAKHQSADASAGNAAQAIKMATLDSARALGLGQLTGSLEPGKRADLISVNTREFSMQPLYDPFAALVHGGATKAVTNVYVNGQALLLDKELQTLPRDTLIDRVRSWHEAN